MNLISKETLTRRFLDYIRFNTMSEIDTGKIPSTDRQIVFGKYLLEELKRLGISARMSSSGVVYAHIPSNTTASVPKIGFLAHMDTPPSFNSDSIHPVFIYNYDGKEITLNKEAGFYMSPSEYSFLKDLKGHDLIISDGTSILGADDKAGVTEIVTLLEILTANPEIPHGNVYAAFTVDEEIGKGIEYFDLDLFPCDFSYTVDVDSADIHCLNYETICDGRVDIHVTGKPVHPGIATNVIRNASHLAMEFHSLLPKELDPFFSKDYDGFIHLQEFTGKVDHAYMRYRVADFDDKELWKQLRFFEEIAKSLNEKYKYPAFSVKVRQTADNMKKYIQQDMRCIHYAKKAMESAGIQVQHKPIRGGTDGALLSKRGLPTPNISNGSYNALSYFELLSVDYMVKCEEILLKIVSVEENAQS